MNKVLKIVGFGSAAFTLGLANVFAQNNQPLGAGLLNFISLMQTIVDLVVPFLIGIAVIAVFVGIIKFLFNSGAEEHAKWGKFLGMAILSLFVIVSIWGLVNFLGSIVGVGQGGEIRAPQVPRAQRP